MNNIPRPEHPNPQWERASWLNLNGTWQFDFDFGHSAIEKGLYKNEVVLDKQITVPFCPESKLSGINYRDFMDAICYKRTFDVTEKQLEGRLFLHFGAVDYKAHIFVNGQFVKIHKGGYSSFKVDITSFAKVGTNYIFIYAEDDVRGKKQPKGKQAHLLYSSGADYTRTTGIWQTVWLEWTPEAYIKSAKYYPDINDGTLTVIGETVGKGLLEINSYFEGRNTGFVKVECTGGIFKAVLKLTEKHLWNVGDGKLYDLEFVFGDDKVNSYFGLREIKMVGMKFMLNGKSVFQRTVLDQGFYPDGVYTAPTDADLLKDIMLSLDCGFNGARLHQKVFEPRFLYYADKIGYIVWGEHANWGMDYYDGQATETFLNEWAEIIERDFNHPSIIGWCPFNETFGYVQLRGNNTLQTTVFNYTKTVDITRPCIDSSGFTHNDETDIYDIHDYDQSPESFKAKYDRLETEGYLTDWFRDEHAKDTVGYRGEPVFMSEYGGIQWNTDGNIGWGYGAAPKSEKEFLERYKGLTDALLDNPKIMGFCYTQLYDIEQEINGIYTYDRKPKFDVEIFKAINTRKAAIED